MLTSNAGIAVTNQRYPRFVRRQPRWLSSGCESGSLPDCCRQFSPYRPPSGHSHGGNTHHSTSISDTFRKLFQAALRCRRPRPAPPPFCAITQARLPASTENSLVALHTSAGKTLLGELCLVKSLDPGPGLAVYIAPYVALGRQVAEGMKRHVPSEVRIHTLVDGFQPEASLEPTVSRELVVATPERLDAILRNRPELLQSLRCVVVDECILSAAARVVVRLEGILARLRMIQHRGHKVRLVLLSAVMTSYNRLQRWLEIPDHCVITDSWRPTARRLAIWERDGRIRWYRGSDVVCREHSSNLDLLGSRLLPWPKASFYPAKHYGAEAKTAA